MAKKNLYIYFHLFLHFHYISYFFSRFAVPTLLNFIVIAATFGSDEQPIKADSLVYWRQEIQKDDNQEKQAHKRGRTIMEDMTEKGKRKRLISEGKKYLIFKSRFFFFTWVLDM